MHADVFLNFKDQQGNFVDADTRSLLSLYNAAHLLTHGEVEFEEAIPFARHHLGLGLLTSSLRAPLAGQVTRALKLPLPIKDTEEIGGPILYVRIHSRANIQSLHTRACKAGF